MSQDEILMEILAYLRVFASEEQKALVKSEIEKVQNPDSGWIDIM